MNINLNYLDTITRNWNSFSLEVTEFTGEAVALAIAKLDESVDATLSYKVGSWIVSVEATTAAFVFIHSGKLEFEGTDISGFLISGVATIKVNK